MPIKVYSNPPPLPDGISERLQKMIDPKTGCCMYHPQIRLCELVNDETRWVVRRKTCFQCGSRPDGVGGRHHMPGKSIKNPSIYRPEREKSSRRSLMSSSRSGSSRSSIDS